MAALANLVVELSANSAKLVAGMNRAEQRSNQLASTVKKLGATLISAFAARELLHGMEAVVEKFGVQQRAVEELRASLEITGKTGAASLTMLVQNAAALQKVTTTADEALISATSTLAQLAPALNARELQAAQKALIGIADTFAHGDVQNAALLLGKTVGSTTNALTRYGITVNMAGTESQKLAQIVEQSAKFFGVSEARAKTLEGRLTQLKNAWGDLQEAIGGALASTLKFGDVSSNLTEMLQLFTQFIQAGDFKTVFATAGQLAGNYFGIAFTKALQGVISLPDAILRSLGIKGKGLTDLLASAFDPFITKANQQISELIQRLRTFAPAATQGPAAPAAGGITLPTWTVPKIGGGGGGGGGSLAGAAAINPWTGTGGKLVLPNWNALVVGEVVNPVREAVKAAAGSMGPMNQAIMASVWPAKQLTTATQHLGDAARISAVQMVQAAGSMIAGIITMLRQGSGNAGGFLGGLLGTVGGFVGLANPLLGAGLMAGGAILSAATAPSPSNPVPVYDSAVERAVKDQTERPQDVTVIIEQGGVSVKQIAYALQRNQRRGITIRVPPEQLGPLLLGTG